MTELPSFQPLAMIARNILDTSCSHAVKEMSCTLLHNTNQAITVLNNLGEFVFTNNHCNILCLNNHDDQDFSIKFKKTDLKDPNLKHILDFGFPIIDYKDNVTINDTEKIPVLLNIHPIFNDFNDRLGSYCIIEDITTSERYNELLEKSELIFNSINIGIITVNDNIVSMVNKYARNCFGLSNRSVINKPFIEFAERFLNISENAVFQDINNIEIKDYECNLSICGKTVSFLCDSYFLRYDKEGASGAILFLKDITSIKEMEKRLINSEKLKVIGELAAGTAHEIRNPLTTVRGFLQILHHKASNLGINDLDLHIKLMLSEIDRANEIISKFLNLAKPKTKNFGILNINELLNEISFIMENEAKYYQVNLSIKLDEAIPNINGDKNELSQVFFNIIHNALQSLQDLPEQGNLKIRTSLNSENQVFIEFTDNGKGIPEGILTQIFDPFFTTKADGSGLGLAVSNRIISDHNGEIKVTSEEGKGTTFLITLPVCQHTPIKS